MSLKGDFGVSLVAYQLMRYGWYVALNYGSMPNDKGYEVQGYDIFAKKGEVELKIEVKLRDEYIGSRPTKFSGITKAEVRELTHFIAVVYDEKTYSAYIVPKRKFKELIVPEGNGYYVLISKIKVDEFKADGRKGWNLRLKNR